MAPDQILKFWLDETAPEKWYSVDLDFDAEIKHRFDTTTKFMNQLSPLMHSENLIDQDRCVRLLKERMCDGGGQNLLHARAHREVIRNFGRFPERNSALSRKSSQAETDFIRDGGYGSLFQNLTVAI